MPVSRSTGQVLTLMRLVSGDKPLLGYQLLASINQDIAYLRNMTDAGNKKVYHGRDRGHLGKTKQLWTRAVRNGLGWCELSRGIYWPYTDIIGGESSEAGFEYLKRQMREGRDPVFDRPGTLVWSEDFIENLGPINEFFRALVICQKCERHVKVGCSRAARGRKGLRDYIKVRQRRAPQRRVSDTRFRR